MLAGSEITTSGTSKPTSVPRFSPDQGEDSEETTEENRGFLQLLQTGELADVDVVVGERTFQCHKAILGAKSPFFKAAFVHDMKEKATGKITIDGDITTNERRSSSLILFEGLDSNTAHDLLVYCYGGKIENIEEKSDKLLAASDQVTWLEVGGKPCFNLIFQYALKHLKRKCEEVLCQSVNISNCLDLLLLADLHSTDILKPLVIKVVAQRGSLVEIITKFSSLLWRTVERSSPRRNGRRN